MRAKLLGFPTSMALETVRREARGINLPLRRNSGTTSLVLVAATNWAAGRPMRFVNRPAVRLPKFPLGTENTAGAAVAGSCAKPAK